MPHACPDKGRAYDGRRKRFAYKTKKTMTSTTPTLPQADASSEQMHALHEEAMALSFKASQATTEGEKQKLYKQAYEAEWAVWIWFIEKKPEKVFSMAVLGKSAMYLAYKAKLYSQCTAIIRIITDTKDVPQPIKDELAQAQEEINALPAHIAQHIARMDRAKMDKMRQIILSLSNYSVDGQARGGYENRQKMNQIISGLLKR
jgi:hypothetical protein